MWTGRFFWGEEEDRKFPQLLLSTSPPSLKAEHALRSFTDCFSDKIAVRKASAAFIPLISQNWNTCTRQLVHALQRRCCSTFSPSLVRRSMRRWGYSRWVRGLPGQCQRSHWGRLMEMGTSESVLGMSGTSDTELHPSRHLADVELQGVVVLPYKTQGYLII